MIHWPISIVLGFAHCKQWARVSVLRALPVGQTPRGGVAGLVLSTF